MADDQTQDRQAQDQQAAPESSTEQGAKPDGGDDKGFPAETPVKDMTPDQQAEYWKKYARKHEDALKSKTGGKTLDELVEAARKLKEIEDSQKSEADKVKEREESLAKENATLKSQIAALKAAVKFGLDEDDLTTLEGLPADKVEALAERLANKQPKAPPADGQGKTGGTVHDKDVKAPKEIVDAALT